MPNRFRREAAAAGPCHLRLTASTPSDRIAAFVQRWSAATGSERANRQLFLTEQCELLGLPKPDPAREDTRGLLRDLHDGAVRERVRGPWLGPVGAGARVVGGRLVAGGLNPV